MLKRIAVAALLVATPALAASSSVFTWTGYGLNVPGSGKCPTYKMTIDVTVTGTDVKGRFLQEGRTERHFETTLAAGGAIKTKAKLDGGSTMDVKGTIKDGESRVILDGYCKFDAKLTKK